MSLQSYFVTERKHFVVSNVLKLCESCWSWCKPGVCLCLHSSSITLTIKARYLQLLTISSHQPLALMSFLMSLVLFDISLSFSAHLLAIGSRCSVHTLSDWKVHLLSQPDHQCHQQKVGWWYSCLLCQLFQDGLPVCQSWVFQDKCWSRWERAYSPVSLQQFETSHPPTSSKSLSNFTTSYHHSPLQW